MTEAEAYDAVVRGRRSIRGFLDKPVPRELIAEIIGVAMRAPSSFNNQCWNFSVVTGAPVIDWMPSRGATSLMMAVSDMATSANSVSV